MLNFAQFTQHSTMSDYFFPDHLAGELAFHLRNSGIEDYKIIRAKELADIKGTALPDMVRCFSLPDETEDPKTRRIALLRSGFQAKDLTYAFEFFHDTDYVVHLLENLDIYPETWVLPVPETLIPPLRTVMQKAGAKDYQIMMPDDVRLNPYRVMRFDKDPIPVNYRKGMQKETTRRIGLCTSRFCNYDMLHKILPHLQPIPVTAEEKTEETA